MTEFQRFLEKIKKGISEYCGDTCMVNVDEVRKNNGMVYHGITITEETTNISPTIYVDELYQKYADGMPIGQIMEKLIEIYERHKINQKIDIGFLTDFAWVKERILFKLIDYERNYELLKEIPHIKFLDMAIVFYCSILHDTLGSITVLVKNALCKMWQVDAKELFLLAEVNTPRILPADFLDMKSMVSELGQIENERMKMYVLTNNQKQFGAACIRYPHVLRQLAEKMDDNLLILPSSVHEVILVPEKAGLHIEKFKKMVHEINRTHVAWEEVLTDSVYYYDKEKDVILQL